MTYEESLAWLSGLQGRGWRLGLDRMLAFVRAAGLKDVLGGPGSPIQYLHVAGTNGKGSVTAYLQSMLVAQGYRTGGYFSPYVVDPRERIQIGGELISEEEFSIVATELRGVAERFDQTEEGGVTEFEVKTAMGFLAWKRAGVEVVALEVGLGGRLDATNVVIPAACAIVSISLDHTSILGHTEAEIAREKAGIIKPRIPCVLGALSDEAQRAIEEISRSVGAPLLRLDREIGVRGWKDEVHLTLRGRDDRVSFHRLTDRGSHQDGNAIVAVATLNAGGFLRDTNALAALETARLPGRMQDVLLGSRRILVDGAHNPAAAGMLARNLPEREGRPWDAVVGMLEGHDPREFFSRRGLGAFVSDRGTIGRVFAAPVDNPRSLSSEAVADAARAEGFTAVACSSVEAALTAANAPDLVVTGSFYLVGEVLRLPGLRSDKSRP